MDPITIGFGAATVVTGVAAVISIHNDNVSKKDEESKKE